MENNHEAIIPPEEWEAVQKELARRKSLGHKYSGHSVFSSRIICGDCGSYFGLKVWNSTDRYRRTIWQCNNKFKGAKKCTTPHLDEENIKERFICAFNKLMNIKNELLANCEEIKAMYINCTNIEDEQAVLLREMDDIAELTKKCVSENAHSAQNQKEYLARYNGYVEKFETAKTRLAELEQKRLMRLSRADAFDTFIRTVKNMNGKLTDFDERLWQTTLETVSVYHDNRMVFRFFNGMEIEG